MKKDSEKNIKVAFFLNLFFTIFEFFGGLFTNSISILSDSLHDFGDSISLFLAWMFEKKAKKAPDDKFTYGYIRFSVLSAFITSLVLGVGSVVVLYNSIPRLFNPKTVDYSGMIIMSVIGILLNGIGAYTANCGEKISEKAVGLHLLEDVLGWFAVLIVSIIAKFVGNAPILDPILSVGITAFILFHVIKNIKKVFSIFLEKAPEHISMDDVRDELKEIEGIDAHHIHFWSGDGVNNYMTLHALVSESLTPFEIANIKKEIRHHLSHLGINHTTIEIEFKCDECENKNCETHLCESIKHHHH